MKNILLAFLLISGFSSKAQDTTFWEFARDFEEGQSGYMHHEWGSETITYLGTLVWTSPSGRELELRIVTTYRKITQANGFNDQSILALVKTDHSLVKTYDLVKRQNLPVSLRDNKMVFHPEPDLEILSALPPKFGERFCVDGMICYDEIQLSR